MRDQLTLLLALSLEPPPDRLWLHCVSFSRWRVAIDERRSFINVAASLLASLQVASSIFDLSPSPFARRARLALFLIESALLPRGGSCRRDFAPSCIGPRPLTTTDRQWRFFSSFKKRSDEYGQCGCEHESASKRPILLEFAKAKLSDSKCGSGLFVCAPWRLEFA